jgi:hypothetical protein
MHNEQISNDIMKLYESVDKGGNPVGMPIKFSKDDPKFANDLSHMTDEDWAIRDQRIKEREARVIRSGDMVKDIKTGKTGKVMNSETSQADGSKNYGVILDETGEYVIFVGSRTVKL